MIINRITEAYQLKISEITKRRVYRIVDVLSFDSLSIALNVLQISNMSIKIGSSQFADIPLPAIAHLTVGEGQFVLVTSISSEYITYYNEHGKVVERKKGFFLKWSGAVMLIEKTATSGDPDYIRNSRKYKIDAWKNSACAVCLVICIISTLSLSNNIQQLGTALCYLAGLTASIFLVMMDYDSTVTARVCNRFNKKLNCIDISKTSASKLFGLFKLSDIGIIWFAFLYLVWCLTAIGTEKFLVNPINACIHFLAALFVPYSIGYQWINKKWCLLCLIVQFVLLCNFAITFPNIKYIFQTDIRTFPYFIYVWSFSLTVAAWFLLKSYVTKYYAGVKNSEDLYKLKHDINLFNTLFKNQPVVVDCAFKDIVAGEKDAEMEILMVTNPTCIPCKAAHEDLIRFLSAMGKRVKIRIRFLIDINASHQINYKVVSTLLSLPEYQQSEALHEWFQMMNYDEWRNKYNVTLALDVNDVLRQHSEWSEKMHIVATPTLFLDARRVPDLYGVSELIYHLPHLTKLHD